MDPAIQELPHPQLGSGAIEDDVAKHRREDSQSPNPSLGSEAAKGRGRVQTGITATRRYFLTSLFMIFEVAIKLL